MRDNEDGKTVAAMDLLVPGVGEFCFVFFSSESSELCVSFGLVM